MRIKEIKSQHRRDFTAIYECEHCNHELEAGGYELEAGGYDDGHFHRNVIPEMKCPNCGKTAGNNYRGLQPKYAEGIQI